VTSSTNAEFLLIVNGQLSYKQADTNSERKVKLSTYRPWRPPELREVEAPTFSDIRLIDGGKVVGPTRRPLSTPEKSLVFIFVRGWVDPRAIVPLEGLGYIEKIFTLSGTRTGDLPACSTVPQPTTLPRARLRPNPNCESNEIQDDDMPTPENAGRTPISHHSFRVSY
jgi:hypothetical protein